MMCSLTRRINGSMYQLVKGTLMCSASPTRIITSRSQNYRQLPAPEHRCSHRTCTNCSMRFRTAGRKKPLFESMRSQNSYRRHRWHSFGRNGELTSVEVRAMPREYGKAVQKSVKSAMLKAKARYVKVRKERHSQSKKQKASDRYRTFRGSQKGRKGSPKEIADYFFLAALAPSLPRAVRVCFGRFAMVRFVFAP